MSEARTKLLDKGRGGSRKRGGAKVQTGKAAANRNVGKELGSSGGGANEKGEEPEEPLLPGWVKLLSRTKQKEYYYNKELQVSQWKRPTIDDEINILKKKEEESADKKKNCQQRTILIGQRRLKERELLNSTQFKPEKASCSTKKSKDEKSLKRSCDSSDDESSVKKAKPDAVVTKRGFKNTFSKSAPEKKVRFSSECANVQKQAEKGKQPSVKLTVKSSEPRKKVHCLVAKPKTFCAENDSDGKHQGAGPPRGRGIRNLSGLPKARLKVNSSLEELKNVSDRSRPLPRSEAKVIGKPQATKLKFLEIQKAAANIANTSSSSGKDLFSPSLRKSPNFGTPAEIPQQIEISRDKSPSHSHSQEEDMEAEGYPEEYLRLLTDISDVRKDLGSVQMQQATGRLTERFLEAQVTTGAPSTINSQHDIPFYVVIDTNVLLNSLDFLAWLKGVRIPGRRPPCFIIPWVVMTELDFIKDNKKNLVTKTTQEKAWLAVQYLHSHLEVRHPQLIGQKPSEASVKMDELGDIMNNDDKVLQCCIQWKHKETGSEVVLLTGDVHLRSKAIILEVPVHSEKSLKNWILKEPSQGPKTSTRQPTHSTQNSPVVNKMSTDSIVNSVSASNLPKSLLDRTRNSKSDGLELGQMPVGAKSIDSQSVFKPFSGAGFTNSSTELNLDPKLECGRGNLMDVALTSDPIAQEINKNTSTLHHDSLQRDQIQVPYFETQQGESSYQISAQRLDYNSGVCDNTSNEMTKQQHSRKESSSPVPTENVKEQVMSDVQCTLVESLGTILELNMKKIYEDLWIQIVFRKPPWTLEDILLCYKKHWIAVFQEIFGRPNLCYVEDLLASLKNKSDMLSWTYIQEFVRQSLALCNKFMDNVGNSCLVQTTNKLEKISLLLRTATTRGLSDSEILSHLRETNRNSPVMDSDHQTVIKIVQDSFQVVWEQILNISTETSTRLQSKLIGNPTRVQDVQEFAVFCQKVALIHKLYSEMLSFDPDEDTAVDRYSALCRALESFAGHYGLSGWKGLTPEYIKIYDDKSRRVILQNGLAQLESLMSGISECNSYLSAGESSLVQNAINEVTGIT